LKVRRLEADRYRLPVDRSSDLEGLMVSGCLWMDRSTGLDELMRRGADGLRLPVDTYSDLDELMVKGADG
jgi:hypothetical protein